MQVTNSVYPNEEQIQGFSEPGPDGPIYMVMRLYGPTDQVLDGTWDPPAVRRTG